ncbi:hypothetical protein OPU71_10275 [Niveibacterium sp. 24ML]|uniref:hypothetical protein n=1 Tax=Niveibacterium sp. 24ML TaxID=2985512 RepID=UPI00226F004A|nr:hypothetical protein [Niveibacterium sp. 24ML]MCX9156507.1 hypothetical protein [Niveibacterium sp. 24ML]
MSDITIFEASADADEDNLVVLSALDALAHPVTPAPGAAVTMIFGNSAAFEAFLADPARFASELAERARKLAHASDLVIS